MGSAVGLVEGPVLGDELGFPVGCGLVGATVGSAVGLVEGLVLGDEVGFEVGAGVNGAPVGFIVGLVVGLVLPFSCNLYHRCPSHWYDEPAEGENSVLPCPRPGLNTSTLVPLTQGADVSLAQGFDDTSSGTPR